MNDPKLKQEWIDALRSGEYQRTTGTLKWMTYDGVSTPRHCCLGVLCEIAVKHGKGTWVEDYEDNAFVWNGEMRSRSRTTLPEAMTTELNITDREVRELVDRNDSQRQTFTEIADYIEREL